MRSLAEFVMKGRREAILAVVLLGIIPLGYLVSSVVLGLLILRRGLQETALVLARHRRSPMEWKKLAPWNWFRREQETHGSSLARSDRRA